MTDRFEFFVSTESQNNHREYKLSLLYRTQRHLLSNRCSAHLQVYQHNCENIDKVL